MKYISLVVFLVVLGVGIQSLYAWTEPQGTPPNDDASPPVNEASSSQIKEGGLGLETLLVSGESLLAGLLDMNGFEITSAGEPATPVSAATRSYAVSKLKRGGNNVLYMPGGGGLSWPNECPDGWTELIPPALEIHTFFGVYWEGNGGIYYYPIRTCVAPPEMSCRMMALKSATTPALCPDPWIEADYMWEPVSSHKGVGGEYNNVRTCLLCQ